MNNVTMNHKNTKTPYWLLYLVGIVAISFSAIFVRWSEAPYSVMAMNRLLLTIVILLPFFPKYVKELSNIKMRDWWIILASGASLGLHFLLWMASLSYTSVSSSTALLTLEPVLVLIGSYYFFREKHSAAGTTGMIIAVVGAAAIGLQDFKLSADALFGDVLSILGAASVAIHMLLGKSLRARMSAFLYSFSVFFAATVVLFGYNVVLGFTMFNYPAREWGIFLLLAVVPTVFGHYLFNWLLRYVSAVSISMAVLGEPVGATILAWFLLSEPIGLQSMIACLILLAGTWIFIRQRSRGNSGVLAVKIMQSKKAADQD